MILRKRKMGEAKVSGSVHVIYSPEDVRGWEIDLTTRGRRRHFRRGLQELARDLRPITYTVTYYTQADVDAVTQSMKSRIDTAVEKIDIAVEEMRGRRDSTS